MIERLKKIEEEELFRLLNSPEVWQSLFVDYHKPFVERMWTQIDKEHRIFLHFIHPCEKSDSLWHPHPWPSAMHVLEGKYEMGVGYSEDNKTPPSALTCELSNGGMYYEMMDKNGWHYVRPLEKPASTLMLIGKPWDRWSPKSDKELKPLTEARQETILWYFIDFYRKFLSKKNQKINETNIKKGDWVELDKNMLFPNHDDDYEKYLGKAAFVIKNEDGIHLRFKDGKRIRIPYRLVKKIYKND